MADEAPVGWNSPMETLHPLTIPFLATALSSASDGFKKNPESASHFEERGSKFVLLTIKGTHFLESLFTRSNQNMKNTKLYFATGITFAALSHAHAATVLIDWSRGAIVTNPAGDGKYWNSLGNTGLANIDLAPTALVDVSNAATGWSVAVDSTQNGTGGGAGFGGTGVAGPSGGDPFDEANAVVDGIFANNNAIGTSTITFTGLGNGNQFDLSAIGGRAAGVSDGLITILVGTSPSTTYDLLNNGTVLNFSVTADASGTISFNFSEKVTDGGTTSATFNAMSITQVPEPSAAFLGLCGCVLLICRRHR